MSRFGSLILFGISAALAISFSSPGAVAQLVPGAAGATSPQPSSVPMSGMHGRVGSWSTMAHAVATLDQRWDPRPRGGRERFFTNMFAGTAGRRLGAGWLQLEAMASLEPALGPEGYPLLLQTGETADGFAPLVDRQHPHDAIMEISAGYRAPIDQGAWLFVYAAPVGSPALGPAPFLHRASGSVNPVTPVSHHFLDSSHITYGVLTAGIYNEFLQVEASWFNGREARPEALAPRATRPELVGAPPHGHPGRELGGAGQLRSAQRARDAPSGNRPEADDALDHASPHLAGRHYHVDDVGMGKQQAAPDHDDDRRGQGALLGPPADPLPRRGAAPPRR